MARWLRLALLGVLATGAVVVAITVGVPPLPEIRARVEAAGWAGPLVYAALFAALSLTPAPATVLTVGAGVLFGWPAGVPVALVGALTGAVLGFGATRVLGRASVEGLGGVRRDRLDALLRRRGLLTVIGIRLVPAVPFAIVNAACGLTAVRARDYVLGSAIGMTPGVAVFVAIGAYGAEPGSAPFLLAVASLAVLVGGGAVLARRRDTAL